MPGSFFPQHSGSAGREHLPNLFYTMWPSMFILLHSCSPEDISWGMYRTLLELWVRVLIICVPSCGSTAFLQHLVFSLTVFLFMALILCPRFKARIWVLFLRFIFYLLLAIGISFVIYWENQLTFFHFGLYAFLLKVGGHDKELK